MRTRTLTTSRSLTRRTQALAQALLPYYREGIALKIRVVLDDKEYGSYTVAAKAVMPAADGLIAEVAEMAADITTIAPEARKTFVSVECECCEGGAHKR